MPAPVGFLSCRRCGERAKILKFRVLDSKKVSLWRLYHCSNPGCREKILCKKSHEEELAHDKT